MRILERYSNRLFTVSDGPVAVSFSHDELVVLGRGDPKKGEINATRWVDFHGGSLLGGRRPSILKIGQQVHKINTAIENNHSLFDKKL